ncbi:MAG TPA: class I SAM-dependent methyltransferase [Tepidisphaeraceae bacterium]|jgi:SAM-dependent methyltransferase|nr:class I SAM-dependent methyltransferase [Tepidisphaeraceae bacterium]
MAAPEFNAFAENYDAALQRGISLSGENKDYFITARLRWLRRRLTQLSKLPASPTILDYGCGTGSAFSHLRETFHASRIVGVDVSTVELEIARKNHPWAITYTPDDLPADLKADIVYCNGTFHHIPPPQRPAALKLIFDHLRPDGLLSLWENNPWNPGTRWVMSRIPFDRDAITLSAPDTRRLVRTAGFEILRSDFLFVFPRFLAVLRKMEPALSRLPLGAQYQILCLKPPPALKNGDAASF